MTTNHHKHFVERLRQIDPGYRFSDEWAQTPDAWRRGWLDKLEQLLGPWPKSCPPDPQLEKLEDRETYTIHRATYATEPGLDTSAFVAIPHVRLSHAPAVLALHGHGSRGAYPVLAVGDDVATHQEVGKYEYDFGVRLAEQGLIVFAPNLRGFGERLSDIEEQAQQSRDTCNINFFQQMLLGEVAITSQLHDLRVALDVLTSMDQVDPDAIGCAGLSYGGRLTMFLSAIEPRIRAAVVAGALNSFIERIESYSTCGYQVVPGLLRYGDVGDVLGLIAPRPLAIELGSNDNCCPLPQAHAEYERLSRIYEANNAAGRLKLFEFEGGHVFRGDQSIPWLVEQLRSNG